MRAVKVAEMSTQIAKGFVIGADEIGSIAPANSAPAFMIPRANGAATSWKSKTPGTVAPMARLKGHAIERVRGMSNIRPAASQARHATNIQTKSPSR